MTERKRTTAIQVRVTEHEKWQMERQARQCGLSLSGYFRRAGSDKAVTAFPSQRFHDLYQQVNSLRGNLRTQPPEQTEAQLDELAGQLLSTYTSGETGNGSNENMVHQGQSRPCGGLRPQPGENYLLGLAECPPLH